MSNKVVNGVTLPTGVTYDTARGKYRTRKEGKHLGYFENHRQAIKALSVTGITFDISKLKHRVRILGTHIGYFTTRTDAVKAAIKTVVTR